VVHSVDRPRLAAALGAGARKSGRTLRCLVQVSLDDDPVRGGAPADQVPLVAGTVASEDGLELGGVMAVVPLAAESVPGGPLAAFERLAEVASAVRATHPGAVMISAGMSADLEDAITAGATHVRVGTALLGGRPGLVG